MAQLQLQTVWLLDPTSPATALRLPMHGGRSFDDAMDGEVRVMAGGRLRAVTSVGRLRTAEVPVACWPDQYDVLTSWKGRTVLYRDGMGQKVWCVFFSTPWVPNGDARRRLVTLKLSEVTYSEAV